MVTRRRIIAAGVVALLVALGVLAWRIEGAQVMLLARELV